MSFDREAFFGVVVGDALEQVLRMAARDLRVIISKCLPGSALLVDCDHLYCFGLGWDDLSALNGSGGPYSFRRRANVGDAMHGPLSQ